MQQINQTILVSSGFIRSDEESSSRLLLRDLVDWVNKIYSESILSPFVVTGGYDFQGIISTTVKGIDIILALEEYIIEEKLNFKLMYVLYTKELTYSATDDDTYETMSEGLTEAKQRLDEIKKEKDRFMILGDTNQLNKMMRITQHFIDGWYPKDRATVAGFLQGRDYKEMSKLQNKDSSSLWRKRKSLAIDEYLMCKEMIHHLIGEEK